MMPLCGPLNVLPAEPVMHHRAFAQRILELAAGDQADLMRAVEEYLAAPLRHDLAHLSEREWEQRHRCAQRDQLGPHQRRHLAEQIQIHHQLVGSIGHIHDLQPAHARRAIDAVARVSAERLGDAHDHVARLGEGGIDREIADHAGDQAVVGIAGAKGLLEQFHAQGFDLVDVLRAGEPAIDLADVPFGSAVCRPQPTAALAPRGWWALRAPAG